MKDRITPQRQFLTRATQFRDRLGHIPGSFVGIINHWTAGSHFWGDVDSRHYHAGVDGKGVFHLGDRKIIDNSNTSDGVYAAHTRGANTRRIGLSMAGMAGARERPYKGGPYACTEEQFHMLAALNAVICHEIKLAVWSNTVLWHSEVQKNLGIKQNGKWDSMMWPGIGPVGSKKAGDLLRDLTLSYRSMIGEVDVVNRSLDVEGEETRPVIMVSLAGISITGVLDDGKSYIQWSDVSRILNWINLSATKNRIIYLKDASIGNIPCVRIGKVGYVACNDVAARLNLGAVYYKELGTVVIK